MLKSKKKGDKMSETCILYGAPCSLYTGKARSYLIKQGICFREVAPAAPEFNKKVISAIHRWRIPVIQLSDGSYIQDSTIIINHFEKLPGITPMLPETPRQKIVALIFDIIGAEGMLRPAMHYRWDFDEENKYFLEQNFRTLMPGNSFEMACQAMGDMRKAAAAFGAVPETFEVIESVYEKLLELLEQHFRQYPYLLGGRPCIGDFGMIGPFYGHLSRDPYPSKMMKKTAPYVFRWTERMNRTDSDMGEFPEILPDYPSNDEIPETLKDILKFVAEQDLVAETSAAADTINYWLKEKKPAPGSEAPRGAGFAEFKIRAASVSAMAQPYRFFLLKKMQDAFLSLDPEAQNEVKTLLMELGLEILLDLKLHREIGRKDNLGIWI
jgi:glutathione S-transferase